MTNRPVSALAVAGLMTIALAAPIQAQTPRMKMTTDIPENVITPDQMETRIGTLQFVDGVPTK